MNKEESGFDFGCKDLQELLEFAPDCVEYEDKIYCLHFCKSTHGFIVEYSLIEEKIYVDLQGVKFIYRQNLFDTYRRDYKLFNCLLSLLTLLFNNKLQLKFTPRIHPFNS